MADIFFTYIQLFTYRNILSDICTGFHGVVDSMVAFQSLGYGFASTAFFFSIFFFFFHYYSAKSTLIYYLYSDSSTFLLLMMPRPLVRDDQIFFSATCPGQVASKNPLVLKNFLLVPKYFSNRKSIGQTVNTTISFSKCNSNQ